MPWSPKVLKPKRDVHAAKELSTPRSASTSFASSAPFTAPANGMQGSSVVPSPTSIAIAAQENKSPRNIRTLLSLAFLAPDIIEAIVDERLKVDTTVSDLSVNLPVSWAEQRRYVGMTTSLAY